MKRNKLYLLFLILSITLFINNNVFSQDKSDSTRFNGLKITKGSGSNDDALTIVEQMPEFPGGVDGLVKFLQKNIEYPKSAREEGIQGIVYITFVITNEGDVIDPKILRGIGGGCDEEAVRVVKLMPKWKPGKQNGKYVAVQFNLPIKFNLTEGKKEIKPKKKKRFLFF